MSDNNYIDDIENLGIPQIDSKLKLSNDENNSNTTDTKNSDKNFNIIQMRDMKINNLVKSLGIATSILISGVILSSCIVNLIWSKERENTYLSFKFDSEDIPFQTNIMSIYILLLVISINFILTVYNLTTQRDRDFLHIFYQETSTLQIILNTVLSTPFLITMIHNRSLYSKIIILISSLGSLICCIFIYRKIKKFKNFSLNSLFAFNLNISIILSLLSYFVLFGCMELISSSQLENMSHVDYDNLKATLAITSNCIYAACAIALISTWKDISYSICLFVLEIGYISTAGGLLYGELIAAITIMGFIFIAMLITVIKHRRLVFGYEESDELVEILKNSHDACSIR